MSQLKPDSLVLYKGRPARVVTPGEKLEIALPDGAGKKVRPKDVTLLHPGPVADLNALEAAGGEVEEAWQVLAGEEASLADLAELAFGEFNPATAWSAWALVADGLYFEGNPETVRGRPAAEVEAERARRETRAAESAAWEGLLERLRAGRFEPDDRKQLAEVERVAYGRSAASRIMKALEQQETPEAAHRLLLRLGYWDETVNPYPRRLEAPETHPDQAVPELPEEPRRDLTHLDSFAIDDEDNRDPDDAVSLDGDRLWVHVADVAAVVTPDSELDREARGRGASLYLPEGTVPMLPDPLTDRLGLGLQEVSPALSFGLRLDDDGQVVDTEVVASWVRVTRLTYAEADARLDEAPFAALKALTDRFRAARRTAGAAFIQLPEVNLRVDDGRVTVRPLPALASRGLVTEAMVMAGAAAARYAQEHGIPFPYATQPPPDERMEPATLAEAFAYRRKMQRSRMRGSPAPHSGLGLEAYAQATSPLRRYLDLVVHQQLRAHLRGEATLSGEEVLERVAAADAVIGNLRKTERFSNQHWKLVYLRHNPEWSGTAVVAERQGKRGKVILPDLALETAMPLPADAEPDAELPVVVTGTDLPGLAAHFRVLK